MTASIDRRSAMMMVAGATLMPIRPHASDDLPPDLVFDVERDDKLIGVHALRFGRSGDDLVVDITIDLGSLGGATSASADVQVTVTGL